MKRNIQLMDEDAYEKLDVPRSKNMDYYKKEYRNLIKKHHPDLGGSREDFIEIQEAYEKIKNDIKNDNKSRSDNIVDQVINNSQEESNSISDSKYVYPSHIRYIDYNIIDSDSSLSISDIFQNWNEYNFDYMGDFTVKKGNSILEGAENNDNSWPYSCRGGACSNCAIKIVNGDVETKSHHILPEHLLDEGYRLSCIGKPLSKDIDIIYNINQHEDIQNYLLPNRS